MPIAGGRLVSESSQTQAVSVNIRGRHFRLGDGKSLHVVDALNFTLPPKSFTCITGPSGCGKTSTLRMILGLDQQYEGEIALPAGGPVAAVFQEPRLLPWRTVEQNIRLVLPDSRQNASIDELLVELGLGEMRNFYPNQLSLGLARRAALARAFVLQPQLLVLDEPFVSLDEATAERLRQVLMRLWQARPTTALMVTHNVEEAVRLADRVLVFSDRPARIARTVDIDVPRAERQGRVLHDLIGRVQG